MTKSSIEWTDATWNPVVGCRRVSPGCEHCYAETMAGRLARMGQDRYLDVVKLDDKGQPRGRWSGTFREVPEALAAPLGWSKPRRVFVNSMSDLFGEGVSDEWIAAVFGVMAACPQHTFQILTKQPERMARWYNWVQSPRGCPIPSWCLSVAAGQVTDRELPRVGPSVPRLGGRVEPGVTAAWPLANVWIGVSVEDQQRADERIPHLLRVPAAVRFLSVEPLIGAVDFNRCLAWTPQDNPMYLDGIAWVIVGGESGHGARPCDLAWVRSVVAQCRAAGVPVFVKQLGARPVVHHPMEPGALVDARCADRKGGDWNEWPDDVRVREWPTVTT